MSPLIPAIAALLLPVCAQPPVPRASRDPFEIRIVDEATGRGVPLAEVETVNHLRFVTDNAGRIAFCEPGLMGEEVFFHVRSHGYEHEKDAFGYAGVKLRAIQGSSAEIRLRRVNVAERLYRITGEGLYRDSVILGRPVPLRDPICRGRVAGQDSTSALVYQNRIWWFWGDTLRMSYPLGHFWMAAATSALPAPGGLPVDRGIDLTYLTDGDGFSRPVCRLGVPTGLIWSDAFMTLPDAEGRDRLVCHFAHMKSLETMLGHGVAVWNDEQGEFERLSDLPLAESWRFPPQAHPLRHEADGAIKILLGSLAPTVRFPPRLPALLDASSFEAFSCLDDGATVDAPRIARRADGRALWRWTRRAPPVDAAMEWDLLERGLLSPEDCRSVPLDVETGRRVRLQRGSVRWNPWRRRFILIAGEVGGTSHLGEIWYAESTAPTGPYRRARKIVTHTKYSFYNPVHHDFLDETGGRLIHFEGTYTLAFSGGAEPTPRYDYNQILYRLDLDDPRLHAARDDAR